MVERIFSNFLTGVGGILLGFGFSELLLVLQLIFWDKVVIFIGLGILFICAAYDWRNGDEIESLNGILFGLILFLILLFVRLIQHIY